VISPLRLVTASTPAVSVAGSVATNDGDPKNDDRHAQLMAGAILGGEDDDVVLDRGRAIGRLSKEAIHGDPKWFWSINTRPYLAPPPHNGVTKTLDAAKQELKTLYEEMKWMGVKPFD
jgi:hypothetical protein